MATTRSSPYGMACPHCNTSLIAPDGSRYVSKHEVYHFWSCEDCGHRIESVVDFRISIISKLINHVRPDLLLLVRVQQTRSIQAGATLTPCVSQQAFKHATGIRVAGVVAARVTPISEVPFDGAGSGD